MITVDELTGTNDKERNHTNGPVERDGLILTTINADNNNVDDNLHNKPAHEDTNHAPGNHIAFVYEQ